MFLNVTDALADSKLAKKIFNTVAKWFASNIKVKKFQDQLDAMMTDIEKLAKSYRELESRTRTVVMKCKEYGISLQDATKLFLQGTPLCYFINRASDVGEITKKLEE